MLKVSKKNNGSNVIMQQIQNRTVFAYKSRSGRQHAGMDA